MSAMSAKKTSKSGAGMTSMKKTSRSSAAGASTKTASVSGGRSDEEGNHGILEGISSLHSWIKTQTMIRPTKLGVKRTDSGAFSDDEEEDVVISLTSRQLKPLFS